MAEADDDELIFAPVNWGIVPAPILNLMQIFVAKIAASENRLTGLDWAKDVVPSDASPFFIEMLAASQAAIDAATDLRALTTAYAQNTHQPRPTLARLAEAQKSSSAGLVKRYTPNTVDAIAELLSETPDPGVVVRAFRSVKLAELAACSPAMEREVSRVRNQPSNRREITTST
ncbi:hypothetical protein VD659_05705 [Herbiconiux sp. 11R-BC]|uniref:hypothetical protein n=1 Tax=Herbiconiux sp. 11R-BC TaxID=3111637 RepID=UPI003C06899B